MAIIRSREVVKILSEEYMNYLKSDVWQRKRSERLKVDNYRCQMCNSPFSLDVHHLNYPEVLGEEDVYRDLITLCRHCHDKIENGKQTFADNQMEEQRKKHQQDLDTIKAWCELKADEDLSRAGKNGRDFCNMDVIKAEFGAIMDLYDVQIGWITRILEYFRNRRYEVILNMMAQGYKPRQVIDQTGFSYQMVHKVFDSPLKAKTLTEKEIFNND